MTYRMIRSKRFWFGVLYFVGLVVISYLITWFGKDLYTSKTIWLNDENGNVIAAAPFSPLTIPPLGTDRNGFNLFFQLLVGAKFTILFVFGICVIQVFLGTILGVALAHTPSIVQNLFQKICKVYFFIPTVLWAILWMFPIMLHSQLTGFNMEIIIKQFAVLCFALLPAVILYVNQEINLFMKNEFVTTSKILGASRFRIIRKHIWLYLKEILLVLFLQQFVQLFTLLIHLSFFGILIGGRGVDYDTGKPFSLTNEWAGLIGLYKNEFLTAPWIVIAPLLFFTISIFVLHLMIKGIKKEQEGKLYSINRKKKKTRDELKEEKKEIDTSLFIPATSKSIEKGS
ncbi:ABC transporter permease subunit [Bacillus wiedmannii]|uniref:ABC transporter permease subunit n=1 Tax=Bacillus wiedmannii TaxID=1890302 RepID=UPI003D97523C